MTNTIPVVWLFCTVIDNFGDIGVTWRLAQQLRTRRHARVFLWTDDLNALTQITHHTPHSEITVLPWQEGQDIALPGEIPDLVIEMFACRLPENVLHTIAQHHCTWLNWEYLSAEDWAVKTHAMRSLQANGSAKFFWQMGFLPPTGGLLREADYETRRMAFRQPEKSNPLEKTVFLFGYPSPVWANWWHAWQMCRQPLQLNVAGTPIIDSWRAAGVLPENRLCQAGETWQVGCLNITRVPFVAQQDFDQLLWAADAAVVRGEDSFVRAQFAAKPFFWHIYPQNEMAHLDKLAAFWRLPPTQCPATSDFQAAFHALSAELNGACRLSVSECATHWQTLFAQWTTWQAQAQCWQTYLMAQDDAVTRLTHWLNHDALHRA